jgi:hypothetical protein
MVGIKMKILEGLYGVSGKKLEINDKWGTVELHSHIQVIATRGVTTIPPISILGTTVLKTNEKSEDINTLQFTVEEVEELIKDLQDAIAFIKDGEKNGSKPGISD